MSELKLFLQYKGNTQNSLNSLNTFQKILGNIIKSPTESKFRLLKRGNKTLEAKIFSNQNLVQILCMLGFDEVSKKDFILKNPTSQLSPGENNFYLSDQILNLGSIENVIEAVRETKSDLQDILDSIPPDPNRGIIVKTKCKINIESLLIGNMKENQFISEMTRIKNTIERLKRDFKMKPKVRIIIQNHVVFLNHGNQSNKFFKIINSPKIGKFRN